VRLMRSVEELERLWLATRPQRGRGQVHLICLRHGGGAHSTPASARVTPEAGVAGDRWIDKSKRDVDEQITLMELRVAELCAGSDVALDAAGDNFLVDLDLSVEALPEGCQLRLGSAVVEVTAKPHLGCKKFRDRFGLAALTWVNSRKERRLRGVNCRVVSAGNVSIGDEVVVLGKVQLSLPDTAG
jgi:MOSC domain-containing protein YiiM